MSSAIWPSDVRGLEFTVLKRPTFDTLLETAPNRLETRLVQMRNPIWHWILSFNYLYATADDNTFNNDMLPGRDYPDLQILMDFYLARRGRFEDFLFVDPDDQHVGPALNDDLTP